MDQLTVTEWDFTVYSIVSMVLKFLSLSAGLGVLESGLVFVFEGHPRYPPYLHLGLLQPLLILTAHTWGCKACQGRVGEATGKELGTPQGW